MWLLYAFSLSRRERPIGTARVATGGDETGDVQLFHAHVHEIDERSFVMVCVEQPGVYHQARTCNTHRHAHGTAQVEKFPPPSHPARVACLVCAHPSTQPTAHEICKRVPRCWIHIKMQGGVIFERDVIAQPGHPTQFHVHSRVEGGGVWVFGSVN